MAENILISKDATRLQKYELLLPQLEALIGSEKDFIANLSNFVAALKETFGFFWIGFYVVKNDSGKNELVLGPFQGPVACTRISFNRGVCGKAWADNKIVIVEDVEKFPGHIACSALSKSEIVLPVRKNGEVVMVLDIDSDKLNDFDKEDAYQLQKLTALIEKRL
ncbi:MAG TPA: GAF domain-containing protein [Bacteroidia bacterium]|nr:GAF domain-containing protein [Bacteroidia bacterium]HNU34593.1 GAF domain-containing protein [Bacteroidia bacterium]